MYNGKIDKPTIPEFAELSIPEHKILLEFTDDEDAIMFADWWEEAGWKAFKSWALKGNENG